MKKNITNIEDWIQWKKVCSFSNCDNEVKSRLGELGKLRLRKYIKGAHENVFQDGKNSLLDRLKKFSNLDAGESNFIINAWHLFDARIVKKGGSIGGKEWLVENASCLNILEARASLLFREVAREFVLEELGRNVDRCLDSLSRQVNEDGLTVEDLLEEPTPDPKDKALAKDLISEVKVMANKFFNDLEYCDQISLITIPLNLSIADARIGKLSGIGKSRLAERKKNLLESFTEILGHVEGLEKFSTYLQYGAENLLGAEAEEWGKKPENKCSGLFIGVE